jgi:hypothetical protein
MKDSISSDILYSILVCSTRWMEGWMEGGMNWTGRKLSGGAPSDPTQPSSPARETKVQVQMQMQQSRFSTLK